VLATAVVAEKAGIEAAGVLAASVVADKAGIEAGIEEAKIEDDGASVVAERAGIEAGIEEAKTTTEDLVGVYESPDASEVSIETGYVGAELETA
jgi:hypothetical protein